MKIKPSYELLDYINLVEAVFCQSSVLVPDLEERGKQFSELGLVVGRKGLNLQFIAYMCDQGCKQSNN